MDSRRNAVKLLSDVKKQNSRLQKRRDRFESDRIDYNNEKDTFEKNREEFHQKYEEMEENYKIQEKAIKDRQSLLSATRLLSNQERKALELKSNRIVEEEKFIQENISKGTQILKINVGGKCFITTTSTVVANQRSKDSMLAAMFSGRFGEGCKDEDGYHFIDRDPTPFEHILTYLRSGYVPPEEELPRKGMNWKLLMIEIEFYGIRSWQEYIIIQEFVASQKLPFLQNLDELLLHIRSKDDKIQVILQLATLHRSTSGSLGRVIEEQILQVISTFASSTSSSFPSTFSGLQQFISKWNPRTSDATTKKILSILKRLMSHYPPWKTLLDVVATVPTMCPSPNATISKEGVHVTKNATGNSWTCGVVAEEPIPDGGYEWSIKLISACNNLMIGVTRKTGFRNVLANYSNNTGHYLYCFNGCLYGLAQHTGWVNAGAIAVDTVVKVKCDLDTKEISFEINGVDKGVAFKNFDTSLPLYPAFDLYESMCTFELME